MFHMHSHSWNGMHFLYPLVFWYLYNLYNFSSNILNLIIWHRTETTEHAEQQINKKTKSFTGLNDHLSIMSDELCFAYQQAHQAINKSKMAEERWILDKKKSINVLNINTN